MTPSTAQTPSFAYNLSGQPRSSSYFPFNPPPPPIDSSAVPLYASADLPSSLSHRPLGRPMGAGREHYTGVFPDSLWFRILKLAIPSPNLIRTPHELDAAISLAERLCKVCPSFRVCSLFVLHSSMLICDFQRVLDPDLDILCAMSILSPLPTGGLHIHPKPNTLTRILRFVPFPRSLQLQSSLPMHTFMRDLTLALHQSKSLNELHVPREFVLHPHIFSQLPNSLTSLNIAAHAYRFFFESIFNLPNLQSLTARIRDKPTAEFLKRIPTLPIRLPHLQILQLFFGGEGDIMLAPFARLEMPLLRMLSIHTYDQAPAMAVRRLLQNVGKNLVQLRICSGGEPVPMPSVILLSPSEADEVLI